MNEIEIQNFWDKHPCGDELVGGIGKYHFDYEQFFNTYDSFRYTKESHILKCLDKIDFKGKTVLEIGLGQGADSEQIIKRGGVWSGLDITPESISRVQTRLYLRNLPYKSLNLGSVLDMPFEDNKFDIVFSHGVLHHVPDIVKAQQEIHRILKPNGVLIVMLYSKYSLNYLLSISLIRRVGLILLYYFFSPSNEIVKQHIKNAKAIGLWNYLKMNTFIHRNTDGPLNPYSKVYDYQLVEKDFNKFDIISSYKQFMHAPPLYVKWLPLENKLGWHLWVHLHPKGK